MNGIIETMAEMLGVTSVQVMAIVLLVIGVIGGIVLAKTLKLLLVVGILAIVASYFGILNIDLGKMKGLAERFGEEIVSLSAVVLSSSALLLGVAIGFVIGMLR